MTPNGSASSTGQQATIDAPLVLDIIGAVAKSHLRRGDRMLDRGYGAGDLHFHGQGELPSLAGFLDLLVVQLLRRRLHHLMVGDLPALHQRVQWLGPVVPCRLFHRSV